MNRTTLIYALVLLVAFSAVGALAQGRAAKQQGPPAGAPLTCQTALGLSQAQMNDISAIRSAFMNDTAALRTEMQNRMREIAGLRAQANPDQTLINQKMAEAEQVRARIRDRSARAQAAVQNVLTPEQRAKCAQYGCGAGAGMGGPGQGRGPCGAGLGPGAGACIGAQGKGRGACGAGQGMGRGPCGAGMGAGTGYGRGAR